MCIANVYCANVCTNNVTARTSGQPVSSCAIWLHKNKHYTPVASREYTSTCNWYIVVVELLQLNLDRVINWQCSAAIPPFTATRIWTIIMALVARLVVKYNPLINNDCVGVSLGFPLFATIHDSRGTHISSCNCCIETIRYQQTFC